MVFEYYDIKSVKYEIIVSEINNNEIILNGIRFKKIPSCNNYFISKNGIIYSRFYNKFLSRDFNHNNYPVVTLIDNNGHRSPKKVHRLVYETYIGELDKTMVIDHKNGKKWCCCDWNLEQVTCRENENRAYLTGLNKTGVWNDDQIHLICKLLQENTPTQIILQKLGLKKSRYKQLTMLIHCILSKKYYSEISNGYNLSSYVSELNKKDRKLSVDNVKFIKKNLDNFSIKELSERFKVTTSTISKIRDGKNLETCYNISYGFNE